MAYTELPLSLGNGELPIMDENIKKLKEIEKELELKLKKNPVFIQLEGIRKTIALFQTGNSENGSQFASKVEIPKSYDDENLTWKAKVLFALNKIERGFVSDIVIQLKKLGAKEDDEFLTKRVGVTISNLKADGIIDGEIIGKKGSYFIV